MAPQQARHLFQVQMTMRPTWKDSPNHSILACWSWEWPWSHVVQDLYFTNEETGTQTSKMTCSIPMSGTWPSWNYTHRFFLTPSPVLYVMGFRGHLLWKLMWTFGRAPWALFLCVYYPPQQPYCWKFFKKQCFGFYKNANNTGRCDM